MNERFVPPYGFGASRYIRPLLIGCGAEVGVKPSKEYMLWYLLLLLVLILKQVSLR